MIDFVHAHELPDPAAEPPIRFVFRDGQNLLVDPSDPDRLLDAIDFAEHAAVPLGLLAGRPCVAVTVPAGTPAPDGLDFLALRALHGVMDEGLRTLAGGGFQLLHWQRVHRFCGACGTQNEKKSGERALVCPSCGQLAFPRIDPAVICGIRRGDRLMLAHNRRFRGTMHSLIAGFVEVGETLEGAVAREIREEIGIEVKNIQYFGSQSWPYPSTIMLGFVAEHASGELTPDGDEIVTADWFERDQLPEIPGPGSISRRIIDAFVNGDLK
jgi:NAD+ diphosphatase